MRKRFPNIRDRGFTLMELIIVLAFVAILAAVLAPLAFSYIEDARVTEAQYTAGQIAAAIGRFLRDTGLPPYKNEAGDKIPAKETDADPDYDCLYGGSGGDPVDDTVSWTACLSGNRDTVENHLISNVPGGSATKAYATAGKNAWKGPYLPHVPPDPWGNRYLVNIGKADPAAGTPKAVWVISAGPNGRLETGFDHDAASAISPGGDDVIARVK